MSDSARPPRVTKAGADIVARLCPRRTEIAQGIYTHIQGAVPVPVSSDDHAYQAGLLAAITDLVDYSLEGLAAGRPSPKPVPVAAVAQARLAARSGVSVGMVIRRYLAAHAKLGDYLAEEAANIGLSSDGPTLQHLRRTQESLLQHLTALIEREYNEEVESVGRSPAERRAIVVHRLLRGELVSSAELAELKYEIENAWHLALIAAGEGAEQVTDAAKRWLGCELLAVAADGAATWAWLGTRHRISGKGIEAHLPMNDDTRLLVAESRHGSVGWQHTHSEARAAWPVAANRPGLVTYCVDVTLPAALLANEALARLHLETYLTPLEGLRERGRVARQTLSAYFACEQNIATTAASLRVTRRTVENRLHTIAKTLRRPLHMCLPELQVALRVVDALGSTGEPHGSMRQTNGRR